MTDVSSSKAPTGASRSEGNKKLVRDMLDAQQRGDAKTYFGFVPPTSGIP
jgi:hypothetical protein